MTKQATTESGTLATLQEIHAEVARHVDVPVRWDRARKRYGSAHWRLDTRTRETTASLSFSRVLWPHMSPAERRNTILHEVAHILAGHLEGHGARWRQIHIGLGGDGKRCGAIDIPVEAVRPKYLGTCPSGHQAARMRMTARSQKVSCRKCAPYFSEKYLITWVQQY